MGFTLRRHGEPLDDELRQELKDKWTADRCVHCGGLHARTCPRVKRMSFHPGGDIAEVEFWPDGKWDDREIVWPESFL